MCSVADTETENAEELPILSMAVVRVVESEGPVSNVPNRSVEADAGIWGAFEFADAEEFAVRDSNKSTVADEDCGGMAGVCMGLALLLSNANRSP